jgi:para-nitrobenzyl esterase
VVVVETAAGKVAGVEHNGVTHYLGVPFAAPPLGRHRFSGPAPVAAWTGVLQADVSRSSPPQPAMPALLDAGTPAAGNEDCLQLDIYTPSADGGQRPVMVWFFGGGFTNGSAGTYDATSLALSGDVVVVTVNYRLGALGFSYLEHIDERFAGSANAGIRDQMASLRWVRDNIAAFGGDPGCVTIFGESAGGHSVGCLLTSPEAQGLFHRCILQSSAGWGLRSREWAETITSKLMGQLGATSVEQLQSAGIDALLAAQASIPMRLPDHDSAKAGPRTMGVASFPFAPTLDGVVLAGQVIDEVAAGTAAEVPMLICHTRDEIKLFAGMGYLPELGDDQELAAMMAMSLPDGQAAVEVYRNAEPGGSWNDWLVSFLTDQTYHMPDFRLADVRVRNDPRVWMARFSWEPPAADGSFGACHGIEIPFLFYRPGQTGAFLAGQEVPLQLAHSMQDAWAAFARTGDPNCASLPAWPRYEPEERMVMSIADESVLLRDPDAAVRGIWEDVVF